MIDFQIFCQAQRSGPTAKPSSRIVQAMCLLVAAIFCIDLATADEPGEVSEGDFFREIPMVYSVSRLPQQPQDTAGAITILDRDFIRRTGVRDLVDLFRLVPGFSVAWTAGGRPVVAYHGLSGQISQRMQVYIDGQSLYAPYLFGGVDWGAIQLPIDEIDRIEIQRGANAVSYGANAFLGVVHIITRSPAQSTGWRIEAAQGANGLSDQGIRWGGGGENWDGRLLMGLRSDHGLRGREDDNRTEYLDWRGAWRQDAQSELSMQLRAQRYLRQTGFSGDYGDPLRDENGNQLRLQLKYRQRVDADQEWALAYARSQDAGRDPFTIPLLDGSGLRIENDREARRDTLEFQHYKDVSAAWRLAWGWEWQNSRLVSEQLFATRAARYDQSARLYLNNEWRPNVWWTLNAGMVYEKGSYISGQWAPRVSVNWKPVADHAFKLGYSSAFRSPSLFEQRADWQIQYNGQVLVQRYLSRGGLQPENIRVLDGVYSGQLADSRVSWDLRVFQEKISDLITGELYQVAAAEASPANTLAYDLRNNARVEIRGVEAALSAQLWQGALWSASFYRGNVLGSKTEISASIPKSSQSFFLSQDWGSGWSSSLSWSRVSAMHWLGEVTGVEAQRWLQFTQSRTWRWRDGRFKLSLGYRKSGWGVDEFRPGQRLPNILWLGISVDH